MRTPDTTPGAEQPVTLADEIQDVFEAFDSIQQDRAELNEVVAGLTPELNAITDVAARNGQLRDIAELQRADIVSQRARFRYAITSVMGRTSGDDLRLATEQYVRSYDDEEGRVAAFTRARQYVKAIRYAEDSDELGAVSKSWDVAFKSEPVVVPAQRSTEMLTPDGRYRFIEYERDEETGGAWVSLTSPRTLESVDPQRQGDESAQHNEHVATYDIAEVAVELATGDTLYRQTGVPTYYHYTAEGKNVATPGSPPKVFRFPKGSDAHELEVVTKKHKGVEEEQWKLHIVIPAGRISLGRYLDDDPTLDRLAATAEGRVALNAAGMVGGGIFASFEDPIGVNPMPIYVPKTQ